MRAFLIAAVAAAAASPAAAKGAARTAPPELISILAPGAPGSLDGLRDFVNQIQPGAGMAITDAFVDQGLASEAGLTTTAGLDLGAPLYLLYVDGGGAKGWVLVAKVSDEKQIALGGATTMTTANGWAAIGPRAAVKNVSAYALATLPAQPPAAAPSATVFVGQVLARYKDDIARGKAALIASMSAQANAMSGFAQAYADGLLAAATDTERAIVTVEADKDAASMDLALVPRPKTRLASFVATQHPSDYGLLDHMPAQGAAMIATGHLEAGPYRQALLDLGVRMSGGGSAANELIALYGAMMKASTGDFAATIGTGHGMEMTYEIGVADEQATAAAMTTFFGLIAKPRTFDVLGIPTTIAAEANPPDHAGVALRSYSTTYDLSKVPAAQAASMRQVTGGGALHTTFALFDRIALTTQGPDAVAAAGRAIDAARGKGARYSAPAEVAAMLAASRARKDSVVFVMDFGAFAAMAQAPAAAKLKGAMVMTAGFADGSMHLRLGLPVATVTSFKP